MYDIAAEDVIYFMGTELDWASLWVPWEFVLRAVDGSLRDGGFVIEELTEDFWIRYFRFESQRHRIQNG